MLPPRVRRAPVSPARACSTRRSDCVLGGASGVAAETVSSKIREEHAASPDPAAAPAHSFTGVPPRADRCRGGDYDSTCVTLLKFSFRLRTEASPTIAVST